MVEGPCRLLGAGSKSGTEGAFGRQGLGTGGLDGDIEVLAHTVGVALAPWAGLVAPATPAACGTSCRTWMALSALGASYMTSGGGAEGKPCRCSPTLMLPWCKAWLVSRRLVEARCMEKPIMVPEDL